MPIQNVESALGVVAMNVPISKWSNLGPTRVDPKFSEALRSSSHDNGNKANSEEEWRTIGRNSDRSFDKSEIEYLRWKKEKMGL
jgi:hypothetical protein